MTDNLYWVMKVVVKKEFSDELSELIGQFCQKTEQEEGVIGYEWSVSDDKKTIHIYERYQSSDAALFHMKNVRAELAELMKFVTPLDMTCYGNASDAFKKAMSTMPVVYMDSLSGFHR